MHNEQPTIRNSRLGDRQSAQLYGQASVFYRADVGRAATQGKVAQQMSWAAHELENFWLLKHQGMRVSYLGLLLGRTCSRLADKGLCLWYYDHRAHLQSR